MQNCLFNFHEDGNSYISVEISVTVQTGRTVHLGFSERSDCASVILYLKCFFRVEFAGFTKLKRFLSKTPDAPFSSQSGPECRHIIHKVTESHCIVLRVYVLHRLQTYVLSRFNRLFIAKGNLNGNGELLSDCFDNINAVCLLVITFCLNRYLHSAACLSLTYICETF